LKFAILGKTGQRSEGFYSHSRNYRRVTFGELLIWAIYKKIIIPCYIRNLCSVRITGLWKCQHTLEIEVVLKNYGKSPFSSMDSILPLNSWNIEQFSMAHSQITIALGSLCSMW